MCTGRVALPALFRRHVSVTCGKTQWFWKPPGNHWQKHSISRCNVVACQLRKVSHQHSKGDKGIMVLKSTNKWYYIFTYASAVCALAVTLLVSAQLFTGYLPPEAFTDRGIEAPHIFLPVSVVFMVCLLAVTRWFVSRAIVNMYYNETTSRFIAVHYNWHLGLRQLKFAPGEVTMMEDNPGVIRRLRGNYVIHGRPYYVYPEDFRSTRYYNLMLGFVKP